jgi:hypothetical protein
MSAGIVRTILNQQAFDFSLTADSARHIAHAKLEIQNDTRIA